MLNSMFPVEDITHTFQRNQSEVANEISTDDTTQPKSAGDEVLSAMTLERAIDTFEKASIEHKEVSISPIFAGQISSWLHTLLLKQGGKKE